MFAKMVTWGRFIMFIAIVLILLCATVLNGGLWLIFTKMGLGTAAVANP